MQSHLSAISRAWRLILGFMLTTWSVAGGPSWGYVGVYFLLSGSFGFSIARLFFKGRNESQDF